MNVEIINIGDELLIGQVVNTNAAWMAEQLSLSGFSVIQVSVIKDERAHILNALAEAEKRAPIVLVSGGIGPTLDDITKQTLCEYFNTSLVFSEDAYHDVEAIFARRGYKVTELNRQQAELPESCTEIPNKLGTARGMWFEKERHGEGKTIFVSMPGVPFEMKAMMTDSVIPALKETFSTPFIYHKTILTQGVGESFLAAQIEEWEKALPPSIKLAYLPQPGIVRLRLTGTAPNEQLIRNEVDAEVARLYQLIPEYIFGEDEDTLELVVGEILRKKGATLAAAESCTGGYIAHLITSIPGSSDYFKGSIVAYSNEAKINLLNITEESILNYGAVSKQVVEQMAASARIKFYSHFAIATSGIAGPTGGTETKPVGTVWIAIATPDEVLSQRFLFGDSRERNIRRAALQALAMLRKEIAR
ncbi:MAG: competence/damage-inducible protein A [Bacteroidetes bacterium]|nr:competence/damage-inducible protein A [Bacteroidota bacterium]